MSAGGAATPSASGPERRDTSPVHLRRVLLETLASHVPRSDPVALLDYPTHLNVGDSAIWLGELAALRDGGWEIAYVCAQRDYDPARVREAIGPRGTVLLSGGGNLGDLYQSHQELRLRVLSDLHDHRVVHLPQRAQFQSDAAIEKTASVFGAHPNLTVLVRDRDSARLVADRLGCRTVLCPDAAVALGSLARRGAATASVLVLARDDMEATQRATPVSEPGLLVRDWPMQISFATRALRAVSSRAARRAAPHPGAWSVVGPRSARGYEAVARSILRSGVALLSRGRVVVTNRLHGHILCRLLGIPSVIVDDRFGKLSSFQAAWPDGTPVYDGTDGMARAIGHAQNLAG